jgi:GH15 family glucan-1,4-alpha-glucosidase
MPRLYRSRVVRQEAGSVSQKIEDYAFIGNTHTAALVGRDGSMDWLCLPRFDGEACFSALLGLAENGRWLIAPAGEAHSVSRRYRDGTLVLETEFTTESGSCAVIDFMPRPEDEEELDVVRIVEGRRGTVTMRTELVLRFGYGCIVPWVRRRDGGISAVAGPHGVYLATPVPLIGENFRTTAEFAVSQNQRVPFVLTWHHSHRERRPARDPFQLLEETDKLWRRWSDRCTCGGPWAGAVRQSVIVLKALSYAPTGGIVAAPTTSLPEHIGGPRNWDYRYCWIRDATFTLYALLISGFSQEARAWREWLLRAVAGQPAQLQIMYGLAGERQLPERELSWLAGYEDSRPVRVGNAAHSQFQLDVYGEIADAFHVARRYGIEPDDDSWRVEKALLDFLESAWRQPDEGIWEVRGPRRHFTHSKVMAWVAVDRAIKAIERFGLEGPIERWRALRATIHAEVCRLGFSSERNSFVQYYGARDLDAALLMIPLVGFLPASDPRVAGTVAAIERELTTDGFVRRYSTVSGVDGLPPGEGTFLPCSFWLADNYAMMGRGGEARALFERLLALRNDVGLLAEEYDPRNRRQLGNFPQAFSHVALINTADALTTHLGSADARAADTRAADARPAAIRRPRRSNGAPHAAAARLGVRPSSTSGIRSGGGCARNCTPPPISIRYRPRSGPG